MHIKCPHCGAEYEVDKDECGQEADCLECGRMFVVGSDVSHLPPDDPSTHVTSDFTRNKIVDYFMKTKIVDYLSKTWYPENETDVDIKCPFCKTAFHVQQGDFGKSHMCKGCSNEFNIPVACICPNDGNIEWELFPSRAFFEKYRWVVDCAAGGFLVWACFSASDAPAPKIKSLGYLTFFESVVIGFLEAVFMIFKTWQGIVGIVLWCIAGVFKEMSRPECSKCNKKLLDVNSPMGWKLYREIYGNRHNNHTKVS